MSARGFWLAVLRIGAGVGAGLCWAAVWTIGAAYMTHGGPMPDLVDWTLKASLWCGLVLTLVAVNVGGRREDA